MWYLYGKKELFSNRSHKNNAILTEMQHHSFIVFLELKTRLGKLKNCEFRKNFRKNM